MLNDLLSSIRNDPLERLRWIVSRAVRVPPWTLRRLPDDEILRCGAQLVLDLQRRHAAPEQPALDAGQNPGFDPGLFARRRRAVT